MRPWVNLLLLCAGCASAPVPVRAPVPVEKAHWTADCARELQAASTIGDQLLEAYRERDLIKLVCTQEKLSRVEALIDVMQSRIDEADAPGVQAACHEIAVLRAEANDCIGEQLFSAG